MPSIYIGVDASWCHCNCRDSKCSIQNVHHTLQPMKRAECGTVSPFPGALTRFWLSITLSLSQLGIDFKPRTPHCRRCQGRERFKLLVLVPVSLVASDASMAMVAGSDTTSATLTGLWYYLLTNDIAYKRLQKEIDAVAAEDIPNTSSRVLEASNMPYLNACMSVHYRTKQCNNWTPYRNETLRLLPALLSGSQRSCMPGTGGKVIGP